MALSLPFDPLGMKLSLFIQLVLALFANIMGFFGYNIGIWIIVLWATYRPDDYEGVFVALILVLFSVLLDIIVLSISGEALSSQYADSALKFTLAMNIMGLLLKPFSVYVIHREFNLRGGDYQVYLPFLKSGTGGARSGGAYEPIQHQPPDYSGFSNAPPPPQQSNDPSYQQVAVGGYQQNAPPQHQPVEKPPQQPVDPNAAPF